RSDSCATSLDLIQRIGSGPQCGQITMRTERADEQLLDVIDLRLGPEQLLLGVAVEEVQVEDAHRPVAVDDDRARDEAGGVGDEREHEIRARAQVAGDDRTGADGALAEGEPGDFDGCAEDRIEEPHAVDGRMPDVEAAREHHGRQVEHASDEEGDGDAGQNGEYGHRIPQHQPQQDEGGQQHELLDEASAPRHTRSVHTHRSSSPSTFVMKSTGVCRSSAARFAIPHSGSAPSVSAMEAMTTTEVATTIAGGTPICEVHFLPASSVFFRSEDSSTRSSFGSSTSAGSRQNARLTG